MILHRFAIGVQFNERMFRLPSSGGILIDEILKLRHTNKKIDTNFFTQVTTPNISTPDYAISLMSDSRDKELIVKGDQFVYKRTAINSNSAVNIEKTIEEFCIFWKAADKIMNFNDTRRIGIAGEFRTKESKKSHGSSDLLKALTKLHASNQYTKFHLQYEERSLNQDNNIADIETDDFWNKIYNFYTSKFDETPDEEMINANIDVQKYYNPAKKDPTKEIASVLNNFKSEKENLKKKLHDLGLIHNE